MRDFLFPAPGRLEFQRLQRHAAVCVIVRSIGVHRLAESAPASVSGLLVRKIRPRSSRDKLSLVTNRYYPAQTAIVVCAGMDLVHLLVPTKLFTLTEPVDQMPALFRRQARDRGFDFLNPVHTWSGLGV